jgi:chromosome segregation ATPase
VVFAHEEEELEGRLEREIEHIKNEHELNRNQLGEASRNAQAENMTKKKDLDDSNSGLQEQKLRVKQARENIKFSRTEHETLQQKKISFAKEIDEREKTIKDKLTRIHELKKKTQELEKFKFVLDYKIRELRRDVGPKEDEINKMNEQIDNMTSEIQHFNKTNEGMKIIVKDLKLKKQGMLEEIKGQTEAEQRLSNYIRSFESDLSALHPDASIYLDYKELKKLVINLYRKYVEADDQKRKKTENVDQQKEFMKERAHLETNVKGEKEKFEKNRKAHKKDFKRMMNHNEELIDETNDLIREIKNLKDEEDRIEKDNKLQKDKIPLDKQLQALEKKIKEATEKLNLYEEVRPASEEGREEDHVTPV